MLRQAPPPRVDPVTTSTRPTRCPSTAARIRLGSQANPSPCSPRHALSDPTTTISRIRRSRAHQDQPGNSRIPRVSETPSARCAYPLWEQTTATGCDPLAASRPGDPHPSRRGLRRRTARPTVSEGPVVAPVQAASRVYAADNRPDVTSRFLRFDLLVVASTCVQKKAKRGDGRGVVHGRGRLFSLYALAAHWPS